MLWIVIKNTIIILCILWFIISIIIYIKDRNNYMEDRFKLSYLIESNITIPFVFSLVGILFYAVIGVIIDSNSNIIEEYKYTTPIYCLNDDSKMEEKSYLFSGYIKENMVYRTIYIDGYGGKKVWEIDSNKASVFEDGKNQVVVYGGKYENPNTEYWF